jgi:acetyl/propionyl-CoA carboxylase alpha subunit
MARAAVQAAAAVNYVGAGTIEFIYSDADAGFYFLEMNTRLQVEHPVTEMVVGLDLVAEQIRVAEGRPLSFRQEDVRQTGHALEVRLYAEDPAKNFLPSTGRVVLFEVPEIPGVRVDAGVETGSEISIYYDPMAAKIIAHSVDRESAIDLLRRALAHTVFFGPENNLAFLDAVLADGTFRAGRFTTRFIEERLADWRGPALSPADLHRAKSAVALLHFHNARARGAERTRRQDSAFDGFRLWGV